jgi:hypothetical protein
MSIVDLEKKPDGTLEPRSKWMKPSGYVSYEDFLIDKEKLLKHPNDEVLTAAIVSKIEMSEATVKERIKDELSGKMMEEDFHKFIDIVIRKANPMCWVIIKSKEDPWFDC